MKYYHPLLNTISEDQSDWSISLERKPTEATENTSIKDGVQYAYDSTSIGLFKACPKKYYYSIVLGYEPRTMAPPLAFGIAFHTAMETWEKLLSSKVDKQTAFIRVVRLAGLLGDTLPAGDNSRTKETLVRSVIWYLDVFWEDKAVTVTLPNGKPAVEMHFQLPFMDYLGYEVFICGHIDRLVQWQGNVYVSDFKTSKYQLDQRFFSQFKPNTQLPLYLTACHISAETLQNLPPAHGVIIDGIQLGVNFSRFGRGIVPFSLEEINEYIIDLKYWITQAMDACKANYFPQNTESCQKYSGCQYLEICSKSPARRQMYLEGNFVKRVWNPLQARN